MFRTLDGKLIAETAQRLARRINDRFPESGLRRVADELCAMADEAVARIEHIQRPYWRLRIAVGTVAVIGIVLVVWGALDARIRDDIHRGIDVSSFIQTVESIIGTTVFLGAALIFLWTTERRLKRVRALRALDELRSVAHIVDMHQLTKDPERSLRQEAQDTPNSPDRTALTPFELGRYLDYCSEMCALVGKLSALHGAGVDDPVVLAAVDQIEVLTTGLSRKVWQKIMLLDSLAARAAEGPEGS